MNEKQTSFTTPVVVVVLLTLLVVAYISCYIATVQREPFWAITTSGQLVTLGVVPHYRGIHS